MEFVFSGFIGLIVFLGVSILVVRRIIETNKINEVDFQEVQEEYFYDANIQTDFAECALEESIDLESLSKRSLIEIGVLNGVNVKMHMTKKKIIEELSDKNII